MDSLSDDSPWPIFMQLIDYADQIWHYQFDSFVLICTLLIIYTIFGNRLDLLLNVAFLGWASRDILIDLGRETSNVFLLAFTSLIITVIAGAGLLSSLNTNELQWKGAGRPLLLPCTTSHARLFPKKHSFSYSYLVAGVPVGYKGNVNGMLSIEGKPSSWLSKLLFQGWYEVDAADYLDRGQHEGGLRGKLDNYLRSQDANPEDFPHAYLVTAPRFLGYHFNPVSFWYLYSRDRILSAIVLEVNNTFDERRPYLVFRDFAAEAKHIKDKDKDKSKSEQDQEPAVVKGKWAKDFHVSPFNSRKGNYSLLASDPLGSNMQGFRGINVTINLSSSKGHPKLVARLFSSGAAADPMALDIWGRLQFISRWCWVGFATFPRIVKEAALLFFTRQLHVWYRPEPLKQSLGRHATDMEKTLETVFRQYLEHLVAQSNKNLSVKYIASGLTEKLEHTFSTRAWQRDPSTDTEMELKVLTPVFYTRFAHYAHDFEGLFAELTDNNTIWVDKPQLLPDIFLKKGSPPLQSTSILDYLYFKAIQGMRRRPVAIPQSSTSADPPVLKPPVVDIRDFRISSMDAFVLTNVNKRQKAEYRSAVLRLFVADHYLMGNVGLLDALGFMMRLGIAWVSADSLHEVASVFR